jgi:hypothetical protein
VSQLQNVMLLSLVFAAIGAAVFSVGVGDCSRTFWDCSAIVVKDAFVFDMFIF